MTRSTLSRDALVEKLVEVFYEYGYDGATLRVISEATGLGKASLYHHFPGGKEQMAAAVLEHSRRWGAEHIGALLASELGAQEKVRGIFDAIDQVHHRAQQLTLMNVFTYGSARAVFGAPVAERVRAGLESLATLLQLCGIDAQQAEARALDAYIQLEGAMVLARTLDDLNVFRAVVRRLPDQLLSGATAG
ncbi:TetR/AcrR family transcriptional regulator [Eleftheria terrae]|uniref:TetR/AcrR family transcriptional regulator n=1 Tax=Eleftheria terrae TaxID=1597781 RepID=UPI00263B3648|nr:TetR/AcrR family transcriptional regulator [Eleftheria terrae]WKB50989.1 TetR/AcrR family transcriptional regulator [Eleftheria terrae]